MVQAAFLHTKDSQGKTALHGALEAALFHLVRRMADLDALQRKQKGESANVAINVANPKGNTALHLAAYVCDIHLMLHLLDCGASPNAQNEYGETALLVFLMHSRRNVTAAGADGGGGGGGGGGDAAVVALERSLNLLIGRFESAGLDFRLSTKERGLTFLHACAKTRLANVLRRLLSAHPELTHQRDNDLNTALHMSAATGDVEISAMLLNAGIHVDVLNIVEDSPLHLATKHGHRSLMQLLLDNGADLHHWNRDGLCPLHMAVTSGDRDVVAVLLRGGSNVNVRTEDFKTPIILAVRKNHAHLVEPLMSAGTDLTLRMPETRATVLHVAVREKAEVCVRELLQFPECASLQLMLDYKGKTPVGICQDPKVRQLLMQTHPAER